MSSTILRIGVRWSARLRRARWRDLLVALVELLRRMLSGVVDLISVDAEVVLPMRTRRTSAQIVVRVYYLGAA